jgi:hypothetical protein
MTDSSRLAERIRRALEIEPSQRGVLSVSRLARHLEEFTLEPQSAWERRIIRQGPQ